MVTCGAQPLTRSPLSLTWSSNPSVSHACTSAFELASLMAQTNGRSDASRLQPSSMTYFTSRCARLPKLM